MSAMLQRANLLFHQERYDAAADAARQHLASDPESAEAHQLLALCLAHQDQLQQATEHAQQAIGLDPTDPFSHYTLAAVLLRRNHFAEAQAAVQRAITIEPGFVDGYSLLAQAHLQQNRWQQAFDAANQGLALDPDHTGCLNLRAMAEVKLGRAGDAAATLESALERSPDNAWAHANQGWVCLEKGDPQKAIDHFKEALRLEPDLEYARAGIVEALKARNFIYRWMLYYFLWMAKFSATAQWGILIGGYVGFRFLSNLGDERPELWPFLLPVLVAYAVFALLTWLATPLFNLMLRVHPIGKYAVSDDQKRGANVLLVGLLLTGLVLGLGLAFAAETQDALQATLLAVLVLLPAAMIYNCDEGWPRNAAWAMVGVLAMLGLPMIAYLTFPLQPKDMPIMFALMLILSAKTFIWAALGAQFAMNYLMNATVRK